MGVNDEIHLGKKIKTVRESKGFSQRYVGRVVGLSQSKVSQLENGQLHCGDDMLKKIKKALEVEGAPFLESERKVYGKRLNLWFDEIKEKRLDSAEKTRKELAVIKQLPFEQELALLFKLFELKLLMKYPDNIKLVDQELGLMESEINNTSAEIQYHYHFNKGSLYQLYGLHQQALNCYLRAGRLHKIGFEKDASLHYNIAVCYGAVDKPFHSFRYLESASRLMGNVGPNITSLSINNALALNHIMLREFDLAKELLNDCLVDAKSIGQLRMYGISLHNYGILCFRSDMADLAMEYFDQAFAYFQKNEWFYLENLYFKARCLISLKLFEQCNEILDNSRGLLGNHTVYILLFDSIPHLMNLKENSSCSYISDIIPRLVNEQKCFVALDYCRLLIEAYKKRRNPKKVLETQAVIGSIYEKLFLEVT